MTSLDMSSAQTFGRFDETLIRQAFDAGRLHVAATTALYAYRAEIIRFIGTRIHDQSDAREVYSMFLEDLWRSLPGFSWRCSMRTWSYCLARNAVTRYLTQPSRRREQLSTTLSAERNEIDAIPAAAPTPTPAYLRDSVRNSFTEFRASLSDSNQMLLSLRIDRGMSFRAIAVAWSGAALSEAALTREAARLRKAFERIKVELRRHAVREGLLEVRLPNS